MFAREPQPAKPSETEFVKYGPRGAPVELTSDKMQIIRQNDLDNPSISPLLILVIFKKLLILAALIGLFLYFQL